MNYPPTGSKYFFLMEDWVYYAYFYPHVEHHIKRFFSGNFFLTEREAEHYQEHCKQVLQLHYA